MTSTKKALLIGCNYANDPNNKLNGCIHDVTNMSNTLVDAFDYDLNNITILRDDSSSFNSLPTRSNIINAFNKLAQESIKLTEIWFHYSGHGSQIQDRTQDESDGFDEIIVPTDFKTAGFITDDEIFNILKNISPKCRVILLFDSCHSGTICDLQYGFQTNGALNIRSNKILNHPNIVCFSGCRDPQTSVDAYSNVESRSVGAFTTMFLYSLRLNHFHVDAFKLYLDICNSLSMSGFQQIPQFSCSSSKVNLIFGRYTYYDVATLKNPTPKLLNIPISSINNGIGKDITMDNPIVKIKMIFTDKY